MEEYYDKATGAILFRKKPKSEVEKKVDEFELTINNLNERLSYLEEKLTYLESLLYNINNK